MSLNHTQIAWSRIVGATLLIYLSGCSLQEPSVPPLSVPQAHEGAAPAPAPQESASQAPAPQTPIPEAPAPRASVPREPAPQAPASRESASQKPAPQAKESAPAEKPAPARTGTASWYGPGFQGEGTASGETYDQNDLTAAHRTLPLGTEAKVTNLETGQSVNVKINDRGPYAKGRQIDLSQAAAKRIGVTKKGVAKVKIEPRTPHRDKK